MKVNVEELSSVERRMTVEVPAAEVDKTMDKLYKRLGRTAKLRGFRPGKAPRSILEQYYGAQVIAEATESLISEFYPKALDEAKLEPVARPDFDFSAPQAGQDYSFKVTLDVKPEFALDPALYKGLKLKEPKLEASEAEVATRLEALRDRQAMLAPLEEDRPAQIGDVVVVDYKSFIGDTPVEGGAADNLEIELGKGQAQQEIEVALVKSKPGDAVQAEVAYDESSPNEQVRGKTVRFEMAVKGLKKKILPELDDDFARAVSPEFESLAALKERVAKELSESYQQQKDQALRGQILDQLRDLVPFDLPASLVAAEVESMVEDFKNRLRRSGMDPDQAGLDGAKLGEGFKADAEKKVRAGLVLGRIAEVESLDVGQEDLDAEVGRMAERMGQPLGVIRDMYIKNNMMPTLTARLLEDKTLQVIKNAAVIEQVDPDELAKETQQIGNEPV
jgi:trigger factor